MAVPAYGDNQIDIEAKAFVDELKKWINHRRLDNLSAPTLKKIAKLSMALAGETMAAGMTKIQQSQGGHTGGSRRIRSDTTTGG